MFYPPGHEFSLSHTVNRLALIRHELLQLLQADRPRENRHDRYSLFSSGKVYRVDELSLGLKGSCFVFSQN